MKVNLEKIKELRIEKKLTQEDVAFELDITYQYSRPQIKERKVY